ncbi:MAG: ubiquinone/menaquinone biosynthesis methyltransferase [Acidobacteriota bacterium]|nr:ubiquinone/menaquinone biosynthesis methyltransferase [Acidobacteriota bacterium]
MPQGLKEIFAEVAPTYERVNRVLTMGFERRWRRKAVRWAVEGGGRRWLDVCSGTGETAEALVRRAPAGTTVLAADFCAPMLAGIADKNDSRAPGVKAILPVLADVRRLPFPDESLDLITLSFATRNLNLSRDVLTSTFREFLRVLAPGGRFVNVETSQPRSRLVRAIFHLYVKIFVKPVGFRISKSMAGYAYLATSIPRFYDAETLAEILRDAGFSEVAKKRLLFGAVAIHRSLK